MIKNFSELCRLSLINGLYGYHFVLIERLRNGFQQLRELRIGIRGHEREVNIFFVDELVLKLDTPIDLLALEMLELTLKALKFEIPLIGLIFTCINQEG